MEKNSETINEGPSDLFLYDAGRAELTGISDVEGFTDTTIVAMCKFGNLTIDGDGLKIESFDSAKGTLSVTGNICGFFYLDRSSGEKKKKGLFSR